MNLLATALVMGILFLPGSTTAPAPVEASTAPSALSSASSDDPSPRKVASAKVAATTYEVRLTGYNAVVGQTDDDPSVTASGARSNSDVIAARSVDLADELPFGTVVKLTRGGTDSASCGFHKVESLIGYRVVADSMNARWTKRMDVQLDTRDKVKVGTKSVNPAIALGVCGDVKVTVVGRIPVSQIPSTQSDLAELFAPKELALR
jgi:3D (Asp-Asp-Asp) domain-containing protein